MSPSCNGEALMKTLALMEYIMQKQTLFTSTSTSRVPAWVLACVMVLGFSLAVSVPQAQAQDSRGEASCTKKRVTKTTTVRVTTKKKVAPSRRVVSKKRVTPARRAERRAAERRAERRAAERRAARRAAKRRAERRAAKRQSPRRANQGKVAVDSRRRV